MLKPAHLIATTTLALLIAACGSGSEPAAAPSAESSLSSAETTDPFAASDMSMKSKMDAAIGSSISDTWLAQMIEHHAGAIAMSKIVLTQSPTDEVRQMAADTIDMQGKEIVALTKLRSPGPSDPTSIEPYRSVGTTMHQTMMAATGTDISETYLRKMLEHHRGAVALSEIVIARGSDPKVRAAAEKTKAVQTKEVAMIEAMLARHSMANRVSSNPSETGTKPAASPVMAGSTRSKPARATNATASHDMDKMPNM